MAKSNATIAKSLKKAGFYESGKKVSERLDIINGVTTKPQRIKMVDKMFIEKKFKNGGPSLAIGRGEKLSVEKGAGLTEKGRAKYNRETGGNLKAPQPQGGPRRDSFCARMEGNPGPLKDDQGRPTRKAASLKRWNCPGW